MGNAGTGDNLGMLREAIARNAPLVLSLPRAAGTLRHHKSRFLADAGDGLWVVSVPEEPGLIEEVIARHEPAGVSFRSGEHKCMFATSVLHFEPHYERAGGVDHGENALAALLLAFPDDLRAVQRRKSFRVPVGGVPDFQVKMWAMTEQATLRDKPVASREISCEPADVSVGGIGVTIRPAGGKSPSLVAGDRVRVQITLRGTVALLEGRLRYPPRPAKDASFRAGVQFRTFDDSREDRHAASMLNKIVNELQRDQIRRKKLGLPTPLA